MTRDRFMESQNIRWDYDPAEKEFDLALGCMIHHAAMAEFFLYQLLQGLLKSKHAGSVTAAMQATAVLEAVNRIVDASEYGEEPANRLKQLIPQAKEAFADRNKYVHGLRFADPGEAKSLLNKDRRRGAYSQSTFTVDDIYDLAHKFNHLGGQFLSWKRHHVDGVPIPERRSHAGSSEKATAADE